MMGKKKRKYNRKCGVCGRRYEQSYMYRVPQKIVSNGWICPQCNNYLVNENYYETEDDNQ